MGQLKKLVPKQHRDRIVNAAERWLPPGSLRRKHFANAISIGGVILVGVGSELDRRGYKKLGAAVRVTGHAFDDIDGDSARRLGTDGGHGRTVDGVGDKIKALVELFTLWRRTKDMSPEVANSRNAKLGFIATKHAANAGLVIGIERSGQDAHSSLAGQANMWVDGVTFAATNVADLSENKTVSAIAGRVADAAFVLGAVTGAVATIGYARELVQTRQSEAAPIPLRTE